MKTLLFLFFNVFSLTIIAQTTEAKIPKKTLKSIPLLTQHLIQNSKSTEEKVTAIHKWITENIAYDYDLSQSDDYFVGIDPKKILSSKKAISIGYTELMKAMLDQAEIKNEIISGYVHDIDWEPGELAVIEKHTWLAINIDGEWLQADPTWDSGYIGRIPTHDKPYTPKVYKTKTFPNAQKEAKVLKKRETQEIARKKKYDDAEPYTNKIGFIRAPNTEFFLFETDSFLVTHLPVLPIWQLRDDIISIKEFSTTEDSLRMRIAAKASPSADNLNKIEQFEEYNYLEQLIIAGEIGALFNPYNPGIKLLNYYNYMSLVHNKNLQKIARGSQFEISPTNYPDLSAKNDTIISYNKLYKDFEKNCYKGSKLDDRERYKTTQARDKENQKLTKKVTSEFEKQFDKLDKNNEKNVSTIEKMTAGIAKINSDYPEADEYKIPIDFDQTVVQKYMDSIVPQQKFIELRFNEVKKLHDSTSYDALLSDIRYIHYLLKRNAEYIQFKSYSTNEVIEQIDSLITTESTHAIMLFNDSLPLELIDKELTTALKIIDNQCKLAKSELNLLAKEGELTSPYKYEIYLQSILLQNQRLVQQACLQNRNFNLQVLKALKNYEGTSKEITKLMEKQGELKEEKFNYILEQTETDHKRGISLIEKVDADSKLWKKKYSAK